MPATPLPDSPDLEQLRRRAKELKRAADAGDPGAAGRLEGASPTLARAQLVIAREHGFVSWPRLVAEVQRRTQTLAQRADAFLAALIGQRPNRAARLLRETPGIAGADIFAAAAAGDAGTVAALLDAMPGLASARDARRGLTPLLYAAATRLGDPAATVAVLLDRGAEPNPDGDVTPLFAAVRSGRPAAVELLLRRGAAPDDGDSLYHATELDDLTDLRLLLAHGASEADSNALAHILDADDLEGTRLLLEHGADATDPHLLRHALWRDCGAPVIRLLLAHGAVLTSPGTVPAHVDLVGSGWPSPRVSTLGLAVRKGRPDVAALLRAAGAPADEATPADELIGACFRAERASAQTVLAAHPGLVAALDDGDRAAICDAAHYGRDAGVALMLDLGFPLDATGDYGGTPLHLAAMRGRAGLVAALLRRGADPDLPDAYYRGTALQWALEGHPRWGHPERRWRDVVELLLAAGASVDHVDLPDDGPIADRLAAAGVSGPD